MTQLSTLAHIAVPFDGDEAKAQKLANSLAANAPDMLEALKMLVAATARTAFAELPEVKHACKLIADVEGGAQ